jgi:beta-lactam-binding protein with PASTA domain
MAGARRPRWFFRRPPTASRIDHQLAGVLPYRGMDRSAMRRILKLFTALILVIALGALTAVIVVRLTVTREGVVVPDLIGKDLVAALELSNKQGLNLKVTDRAFSTSTPSNQIISQDPRPGSWMRPEAIIRVVISKGVGEVAIPAVQGVSWREAKSTLERYGLRVGEIYRVHSTRVSRDNVIAQNPPPASKVMKGGTVTLLASDGPWAVSYVMPDFRGQSQATANEIAAGIGLRIERVRYLDRPEARAGSVIAQQPTPGQRVMAGQGVELVLAKRESTPMSSVGTFTLFQHRVPAGVGPRRVQIIVANADEQRQVFDQMRESGGEVRVLVKVKGLTVAKVYYDGVLVEEKRIE